MSKTGLVIIMVLLAGKGCAQNYFVLLSNEDRQPFYVRLDSVAISSTPDGHLILAPLKDSTYQLTIGFPGETTSEQRYIFSIRQKDQEFQLKKHGDGGWGLLDQQIGDWLTPQAIAGKTVQPRPPGIRKDDAFSQMMADVVNDTAVLYNTFAMEEVLKDSPVTHTPVSDSVHPLPSATAGISANRSAIISSNPTTGISANRSAIISSNRSAGITGPDSSRIATDSTGRSPLATTKPDSNRAVYTTLTNQASAAVPHSDSASIATSGVTRIDSPAIVPTDTPLYRSPVIARLSERKTSRGLRQVYADRTSGGTKADTIVVIIPPDTPMTAAAPRAIKAPVDSSVLHTSAVHPRPDSITLVQATAGHRPRIDSPSTSKTPAVHKPRIDSPAIAQASAAHKPRIDSAAIPQTRKLRQDTPAAPPLVEIHPIPAGTTAENRHRVSDSGVSRPAGGHGKPETPFINSDCHVFATDYDVDKLRMRMLEAVKEDERIATARKAFKIKCYTTGQLRILSEVFGTDGGRFRFLEAAWPFAADARFHELSSLLTDPVYTAKFKSLTGQ